MKSVQKDSSGDFSHPEVHLTLQKLTLLTKWEKGKKFYKVKVGEMYSYLQSHK